MLLQFTGQAHGDSPRSFRPHEHALGRRSEELTEEQWDACQGGRAAYPHRNHGHGDARGSEDADNTFQDRYSERFARRSQMPPAAADELLRDELPQIGRLLDVFLGLGPGSHLPFPARGSPQAWESGGGTGAAGEAFRDRERDTPFWRRLFGGGVERGARFPEKRFEGRGDDI